MRQSLALAWASFTFLALGASPAHYWLDAGEIAAAGADLGVMHPPGAPGLVPMLHLAGLIPLGSLGFRMSLLCCTLAALAIVVMAAVLRRRGVHWVVTIGVVAWVLVGLTFVRNARVVEVYSLGALTTMLFLWGFDPAVAAGQRNSRRLLGTGAAVIGAWGFGDLRLVLVPLVLVAWGLAWRRREPWALWAPLIVGVGSLVVLTLPLASAHAPAADWGNPQTWPGLWAHVMAQPIREAYADEILPASLAALRLNFATASDQVVEDMGPFGPVLLVAAVLTWALRPGDRGLLVFLAVLIVVELAYMVAINPMGLADRQTGYSLGLLAALAVGTSLQSWSRRLARARWAVIPIALTALVLPPAVISLGDVRTTNSWMPHAWSRDALQQLPPGSLVLTQSDDLAAGLLAARVLEGARPDVTAVPAQHLHKGGPDRPGPREAQVWAAAGASGQGAGELGRIIDVLTHPPRPPAPLALEWPGVGVFSRIPFAAARGRPPLGISGPATAADDRGARIEAVFTTWSARIESRADAQRLGRAVDLTLRGWIGAGEADSDLLALAEKSYVRLLAEVDPEDATAMISLAAIHDATGRTPSAIELSQRALELDPGRNSALLTLALFLSRDPSTREQAVDYAERAVALRPHRPENWQRLAQVAAAAGESVRARQAHDIAHDLRAREPGGG